MSRNFPDPGFQHLNSGEDHRPWRWILICMSLFAAEGVFAATCTSQASGNWNDTATWSGCGGFGLPGVNDNVVIANTHTVTLNVNSSNIGAVTINAGGTLQGDNTAKVLTVGSGLSGVMIVNGTLNFGAGTTATIFLHRSNVWAGSGTWNLSVLNADTRALVFTAGTTATLNFSGAAAPIIIGTGTITSLATITWNFTGATAQTLPASTSVIYGPITTSNSAGVTLGVGLSATTILGNLTVQSGVFNNGGFAITLASGRNFALQNAATFNLTGTSSMVTVSGGGTRSFNTTAPCSTVNYAGAAQTVSNETYGHLVLSGSGVKTMPGTAMTIACDFTMQGTASATAAASLIAGRDFNISAAGATFSAGTFSHQVAGNFFRAGTFNANTSTFNFNGTATQSISGATTFNNLTLVNTEAGNNSLTLNNDVTVNALLTFTDGKITTGSNKIIIGTAGSHSGSANDRYVVGTMEKAGPVGTFTFAVGDATNYTPVLTAFSAGGATGSLAANTTAGDHPNVGTSGLDSTQSVNRYWTLTSTGLAGTYAATFTYVGTDKDGGSDASVYEVLRYSGGWNVTTIGTRNATDTQATGLTAFGDFAIGEVLPTLDHYLISHDGSMVTCLPEDITFSAHTAGHTAEDPGVGNVLSISTSTGRGTWSLPLGGGTGTLTDSTPSDGIATYEFPGAESSVTLRLNYTNPITDPEAVNFNVTDGLGKTEATGTAAADSDDVDLSVASAGFVFYNNSDSNTTFPTQIAAKRSDQGFGAKNLGLRAIKVSDSDPTVCATAFPNGADVTVQLGAECRDAATCAGQQVSVMNNGNTTPITTNDDNGAALTSAYSSVLLRFAANSTAELHIGYPDAGQMQLHARYDLGDPVGTYMTGSSNDFVVRPFGFHVTATGNPVAVNEVGTVFKAADEDFTVAMIAKGWQSGDDGDNDGIPDGHAAADVDPTNNADLSDNTTLNNYGQEAGGGEDGTLSAALSLPAGGADPGLAGGTLITSFTMGAGSTSTARYAEVGIIEISAVVSDGDYLGIGAASTELARSKSGHVGRFRPYEFTVSSIPVLPAFTLGCDSNTTDFTYMEQPFDYVTDPQVTITAVSKLGTTTTNYDGVWWKLRDPALSNDKITFTYTHDGGALPGGTTLDSAAATQDFTVDCSGGTCDGTVTFTLNGPLSYTRTVTPAAPFNAAVDIASNAIIDVDGVVGLSGNPFKFENVEFIGGGNQQRWGRLFIGEAEGDPVLALDVPVTAEYFNGTAFILNPDDDCTAYVLADDVELSNAITPGSPLPGDQPMNIGTGTTSVTSGDGQLVDGQDLMSFSPPGAGENGLVEITLDQSTFSGADIYWLMFDWNGDGLFDARTDGRASFGIISGPQGVIYSREPW